MLYLIQTFSLATIKITVSSTIVYGMLPCDQTQKHQRPTIHTHVPKCTFAVL